MRARQITMTAFLVAAIGGGCKDDGAKEFGGGIAIEEAPDEVARAICPRAYDCCMASQLMSNDLAGTDEASCEYATASSFSQHIGAIMASEQKGRAAYRGDKLLTCLAHVRAASCTELQQTSTFTRVAGCDSFVDPKVPPGGACTNDEECIAGTCQPAATPGADGTCVALPVAGAACANGRCAPGLACDSEMICSAPAGEGSTCQGDADCASGACAAGTCGPPRGGQCFYSSACSATGGRPRAVEVAAAAALAAALLATRRRRRDCARAARQ